MKNIILILILFFLLVSCEKELDFKYHDVESQFVIEGTLSESGSEVILSYTVPMDQPLITSPVIDAEVILKDLTKGSSYTMVPEEGIFKNKVPGIPTHNYELSVKHKDRHFKSTCIMRSGIEIIDLKFEWIKMPYDSVAVLEIVTTVSETKNSCYWTKIYKNGEPYKWLMSHGSGAINGKLIQTTFTTRKNPDDDDDKDNLQDGDELNVMVLPVSLDMYDYLTGITSDSNGPQMFTGDFCLGYFLAAEKSEKSIVFQSNKIF